MGRSRGGKRRTVLQLGDQKDSYLSRYGYSRQEDYEEEGNTGNQYGGESDTDEELDGNQNMPEDGMEEIPLPPMPSTEVVKPKADIDDKVANFLAEIDALDPEDEPTQSEVDIDLKPNIAPIDPKPSFQLNVDQIPSYMEKQETKMSIKQEPKVKQELKTVSSYTNMFVQGASEFTRTKEDNVTSGKKELKEQWPDEPISDWQQILDDNTQCYYYWNVQTNDVRWEIPPEYTQYLLLRKEYEEKTDRLTKEGKTQPSNPRQIRIAADGHHLIEPESSAVDTQTVGSKLPAADKVSDETPCVSSTSNVSEQADETSKKNSKQNILQPKADNSSYGPQLPDSTATKTKKPKLQLVDAIYDDESDECSSTSSEIDSDEEAQIEKARLKKQEKKKENVEDSDIDLDDIDKALEMALEKKKPKEEETRSSSSSKKSAEKSLKKKTLVEEMREQVQKKQEIEARRKAAIEEMMARELERRVGPPRQSSIPEEPAFRPKVMDYEHGRKKSKSDDYDNEPSVSSRSRDADRDSKRKRDDRKSEKDRDRKRRKDDKDSHRKDRDDKDERKKEKDDKKRDKDRHRDKDDRKSDSKKREERSSKDEEKHGSKKKEEKEKTEKKNSSHDESESKEKKIIVESEIVVPEVEDTETNKKTESKEVLLANMRQQASELAELALSKLEFLEVTKKGLSKLQILLMELETRQYDWQSGGLDTEYFLKKLDEANLQLEHYEKNAAPPGWSCHWDRAYRRYFYMSKRSGRTQWDYPDEEEEEEEMEDIEQESEKDDMETESSEQSQTPVIAGDDKNGLPSTTESNGFPNMTELDQVTSTTTVSIVTADTTSVSQTYSSSTVPVIPTTSVIKSELQAIDTNYGDDEMKDEEEIPAESIPTHDPSDIESALNFIIGTDTPIASGEPPPPGTGLDMLLIAPPPPPPPIEEYPDPQKSQLDTQDENVEDSNINIENTNEKNYVNSDNINNFKSSTSVTMETNDLPLPDVHDTENGLNQVYNEGDTIDKSEAVITRPPVVSIARPPQIVSSSAITDGSGYSANISSAISYDGQSSVVTSQSIPFVSSSTSDQVAGTIQSKSVIASSSTTDAIATTQDTGHHHDKKKKKKDKDKSISSASLTLKKKNVSSLVQKWQKVKKEVEIEERHREEREMAIRQKLEEWKKDHS